MNYWKCFIRWVSDILIFQWIVNGSHHAYSFDIRSIGIAVFDAELSLISSFYLSQFTVRVFGKLDGGGAGVLCCFFYHLRFHGIEPCKVILHVVAVISSGNGDALLQKLTLFFYQITDKFHFVGCNSDDSCNIITELNRITIITVGLQVDKFGSIDTDFLLRDTFCLRKVTIVWFVLLILLYKAGKSFPTSLYIRGQVTLLAGTSISANPLTVTTRSLPAKVSSPFW